MHFPSLNFLGVVFGSYLCFFGQLGHTALIEAASSDANYAIVELLLKAGAIMEAMDEVSEARITSLVSHNLFSYTCSRLSFSW